MVTLTPNDPVAVRHEVSLRGCLSRMRRISTRQCRPTLLLTAWPSSQPLRFAGYRAAAATGAKTESSRCEPWYGSRHWGSYQRRRLPRRPVTGAGVARSACRWQHWHAAPTARCCSADSLRRVSGRFSGVILASGHFLCTGMDRIFPVTGGRGSSVARKGPDGARGTLSSRDQKS